MLIAPKRSINKAKRQYKNLHSSIALSIYNCCSYFLSSILNPQTPFHELMQSRGVRRPSVCKLFCANRFFYHKHDWIATKLTHDGPHMGLHPGCAQGQGQGQTSRDTDTFVISQKSLLLAGKWLDRDQTCTRWSAEEPASTMCSRSTSRSKVT